MFVYKMFVFVNYVYCNQFHILNVSIDLRVDISLNALNGLYCTVHGGLVVSYSWKVNGSHHYDGLFEENQIINFSTVTSQLIFTGYSSDLVGTFQCCIIDGSGRTVSSDILQENSNALAEKLTTMLDYLFS